MHEQITGHIRPTLLVLFGAVGFVLLIACANDSVVFAEQPKITPEYFAAMRIPLLHGRAFTWADDENSAAVTIVTEALARAYWPGENPIGKRLSIENRDGKPVWREVVGTVADVRQNSLTQPMHPHIFVPFMQFSRPGLILAIRAQGGLGPLAASLHRQPDEVFEADVWAPNPLTPTDRQSRSHFFVVIGRLKAGVTTTQAQQEMNRIAARLAQSSPATNRDWGITVKPLHDQITGPSRKGLLVLLGAVGFVLLIACANVANHLSHLQYTVWIFSVVARTQAEPAPLIRQIQAEILKADKDLPIYNVRTLEQAVSASFSPRRFTMLLLRAGADFVMKR